MKSHYDEFIAGLEYDNLISDAEADPEAAARVLLIIAEHLRNRESLPRRLANYIADAFEKASVSPVKKRHKVLGHALNLTCPHRRRVKPNGIQIGEAFERALVQEGSKNKAATRISVEFGISESTAARLYNEYTKEAEEFAEEIEDEEFEWLMTHGTEDEVEEFERFMTYGTEGEVEEFDRIMTYGTEDEIKRLLLTGVAYKNPDVDESK